MTHDVAVPGEPFPALRLPRSLARLLVTLFAGGVVSAFGCESARRSTVVRADSAGVEIVTTSGPQRELAWSADTIRSIGGADTGPGAFFRLDPAYVDVDGHGRIYVLDPTASRVVAFDSSGAFLRSLGRAGGGPGELEGPISVTTEDDGAVWVYDASRGALVGFDAAGAALPGRSYESATLRIGFKHAERVWNGFAYWTLDPFRRNDDRTVRLWWKSAADSVLLVAAPWEARTTARYPECGMTFTANRPFSPFPSWSQSGDRVAVVTGATYRVAVFRGKRLLRILQRPVEPVPLTEGEVVAELEANGVRGPCGVPARTYVKRQGFYPVRPILKGVTVLPDGSIWVLREERSGRERIDVFEPDGAYSGTLPPAFPFPVAAFPDGRILTVVRDELDVECLLIVHLRRSASSEMASVDAGRHC